MKTLHNSKKTLIPIGLMLALAGPIQAQYNPIPLTPETFNADAIVEKTAPMSFSDYVTATMDQGTNNGAWTWFEQGYEPILTASGVPVHGTTFSAADNSGRQFTMAADYAAPNALCVYSNAIPTGTLTLTTPTAMSTLTVLNAGGGESTIAYTIHHQGGGTESGTILVYDWFNTSASPLVAWYSMGRVNMDNGNFGNLTATANSGQPRLFYTDLTVTDTVNPVTSIDFATTSGNRAVIFGLCSTSDSVTYTPVPVTGFNRDMIVENTALRTGSYLTVTTATMDNGRDNFGNTWYEKGFNRGNTGSGVPNAGATFSVGNHTWKMAPSYTVNNVLFLSPQVTTGRLTVSTPGNYSALSIVHSAGNGPVDINYVVNHADGGAEYGTFQSLDWFNTTATPAFIANGRFQVETLAYNNVNANPQVVRAFFSDILNVATTSPVTSIDFSYVSTGGRSMIMAVSGSTDGSNYSPLAVTGYNDDGIVEASAPALPNPMYTATTVSMDGGTNNTGNTWFEQGYYRAFPNSGIPPAGTVLTSASLPDNKYQMPDNYAGNNAIYVDASHTNANITPATPAWYSALSFLSATANNNVTNKCVIQYSDGTSETNIFVSRDWFNNDPYAFTSRGRVNLGNRTINNATATNPRLYEAVIGLKGANDLANQTYTVTNIQLSFVGAVNPTTGRMVALAVSGSTSPVAPIIGMQPAGLTTIEGSNVVLSVAMNGGTQPFTYQWQVGTNNVWADMADGGNISGSTSTALSFSPIYWTNAASYRIIAAGTAGRATSAVATVTVRSGLPNMATPGDPIAIISGTVNANEGVDKAIDRTTSKYLNNDPDKTNPFTGPVGFILTPSIGSSILNVLRFYTANDATERDPADYTLEGSNDGGATFTKISSGSLSLPTGRNGGGAALNPITQNLQEVRFNNTVGYTTYKLTFNTVRTPANTSMMQIGEIEFLGAQTPTAPIITVQPVAQIKAYVDATPTLSVVAKGYPTNLTYQWYKNGTTAIPDATSATYKLPAVQMADSGSTFSCTVANTVGSTPSSIAQLTVIAKPTQSYPTAILADNPAGYWRLDETPDNGSGNNGTVANDYWGGFNGQYTNTVLAVNGYNPTSDPDTAAQFGLFATTDSHVANIGGLTFAAPTNSTVNFSVEAWVNGAPQSVDAGIVTKGTGGGGEQFNLDTGASGHGFRFFIHEANGAIRVANGTVGPDSKWHHVVGVCDQANSNITLYVDGIVNATGIAYPNNGISATTSPTSIGGRQAATGPFDLQFNGVVDDVAIYSYALSSNQVLSHYYAAQYPPIITQQPTNTTTAEGSVASFYSKSYGAPTLTYQWYQSTDSGVTFTPVATGGTSADLAIANVPAAVNNNQYQVVVSNPYGSVTSSIVTLTIISGPPQVIVDLPQSKVVYAGRTLVLPVSFGGTVPFTYQWQRDGVDLVDDARVSGSKSNVLSIANAQLSDAGSYAVVVNNARGSATSTPCAVLVQTRPGFNDNGLGWGLNGGANGPPVVLGNVMTMTYNGTGSDARSAFYSYPLYIGGFTASFVYQDTTPGGGGADGAAFVLQNSPAGPTALGGAGGALAYGGIAPSAAIMINIYSGSPGGVGIAPGVNGARLDNMNYFPTDLVNVAGGNPIQFTLVYTPGNLQVTMKDLTLALTYQTNLVIDLPAVLGQDSAYVGFTAATGGVSAEQLVKDFLFVPTPVMAAQLEADGSILLSWPASVGGYKLQQASSLTNPTWQDVPVTVGPVNGQVVVPSPTGSQFYRLVLP